MLYINKETDGDQLNITLEGRLDTAAASDLEGELRESLDGATSFSIDLKELEYISSAGLHVLFSARKFLDKPRSIVIRSVSKEVREVFEVTGFSDMLTIE